MGRGKGHVPVRTCICCGKRKSKNDLIRLVLTTGGKVVRDTEGRQGGRGAYVCDEEPCLTALKANRRLGRAFRTETRVVYGQSE